MSLEKYSHEDQKMISMIDLAGQILHEEKKALPFNEIFDRVAELKGFDENEKENKIAQFYTDVNVDGRFLNVGTNMWGLKRWYPVEQVDDELTGGTKKKSKKAKKAKKAAAPKEPEEDNELDVVDDDIEEVIDDEFAEEVDDEFDEDFEELDDTDNKENDEFDKIDEDLDEKPL